jgi:hypothetical protein
LSEEESESEASLSESEEEVKPKKKKVNFPPFDAIVAHDQAPAKKSKKAVKAESDLSEEEKPKKKVCTPSTLEYELNEDACQARQEGAGR